MRPGLFHVLLVLLMLTGVVPAAGQSSALDGWGTAEQWDRAVELSTENQRPIVVLVHRFGNSTEQNSAARQWANDRSLRGMIPIHLDTITSIPVGRDLNQQVRDSYNTGPRLFILDPQLRVVGYRNYRHRRELAAAVQVATQVLRWQANVEREVARAEQLAEQGRLTAAIDTLDKIAEHDIRSTHAINLLVVSAADGETPVAPEPPTAGRFYPGLVAEKRPALLALADKRITETEHLFQDLKFREAQAAIRPLATDRGDLPQHERARDLHNQINQALRQQPQ